MGRGGATIGRAGALAILVSSPAWGAPNARPVPEVAWSEPAALVRIRANGANEPVRDPAEEISLAEGERLALPVRPGDRIRVEGNAGCVGMDFGADDGTNAVWQSCFERQHTVRVPSWSSAHRVLVRSETPGGRFRIHVAQPIESPMEWYRADEAVWDWLGGTDDEPPWSNAPSAAARETLAVLKALRSAWGTSTFPPLLRTLLHGIWLERAAGHRPLEGPFVHSTNLLTPGDWDDPGVLMEAGQRQILFAPAAEIVTLLVEGDARYDTVVRVLDDHRLLTQNRIRLGRRSRAERDFSLSTLLRFATRSGSLRIEVQRGRARVRARAYGVRPSVTGGAAHRMRSLWARSPAPTPPATSGDEHQREGAILSAWRRSVLTPTPLHLSELLQKRTEMSNARRLVLLHELVRLESKLTAKIAAAQQAARLGSSHDPKQLAPLFVSILDELVRAGLERETIPAAEMALLFPNWDEAILDLDLRRTSLLPPGPGTRSRLLAQIENESLNLSYDAPRVERLREAWREGAPYTLLAAPSDRYQVTHLVVPDDGRKDHLCSTRGPGGADRWTILGSSARRIRVADDGLGFASIPFRALPTTPARDGWAWVNDMPVPVHLGGRIPTRVALHPGVHLFRSTEGMPLLARIPRNNLVPCRELRIVQSWPSLDRETTFTLPDGLAFTAGRLTLGENDPKAPVQIQVEAASSRQTIELNGDELASAEFLLPGEAREVTLRASRPVTARVEARAFPATDAPDAEATWLPRAALDEEALLEELTKVSQKLLDGRLSDALRRKRAYILERLGYPELAERDLHFTTPGAPTPVPPLLDAVTQTIVPLGTPSQLPPLPAPDDPSRIERAFADRDRGVPVIEALSPLRSHFQKLVQPSPTSPQSIASSETLLFALWAEEANLLDLAAQAFDRIGLDHHEPKALKRADELRLQAARSLPSAAQRAAVHEALLKSARNHLELQSKWKDMSPETDSSVPEAVVEASSGLDWHAASHDRGAGTRIVTSERFDQDLPKGIRVRRALAGALPSARLFTERLRLGLERVPARELRLRTRCVALTGPAEACALEVAVDGRTVACPKPPPREEQEGPAPPSECLVSLPESARRLTVAVPKEIEALAWAEITAADTGQTLPRRAAWTLIEPGEPAVVTVQSPGLVKVRMRATMPEQHLTVQQDHQKLEDDVVIRSVLDPGAHLEDPSGQAFPLHEARTVYIPVRGKGGEVVRFSASAPLLVRIEAAELGNLEPLPIDPPLVPLPSLGGPIEPGRPPDLTFDPKPGWLTLGVALSYEWPVLADADSRVRDRYFQTRAHAAREIVPGRAWVDVGAINRLRRGPPSIGGDAFLSVSSRDGIPGGYFRGLALTQPGVSAQWGGRWTLGSLIGLPLTDHFKLIPGVSYTARYAAAERPDVRQDIDVYSTYAVTRPRSLDGTLHLDFHPWVDGLLRTTAHLRLSPDFDGIDRVDLMERLRLNPGAGWSPFWDLNLGVSYRPVSPQRTSDFVRTSLGVDVTFWRWLTRDVRLLMAGYSLFLIDVGDEPKTEASAGLSVSGDFTFGRGVRDFSPFSRPFRDRWEEGAAPISRAESRNARRREEDDGSSE